MNDLDFLASPSNQEDAETLPSSTQLQNLKSAESCPTQDTLQVKGTVNSVASTTEIGENYAKWKKLALVAKSIQKFKSLKVEKIKSEVKTPPGG